MLINKVILGTRRYFKYKKLLCYRVINIFRDTINKNKIKIKISSIFNVVGSSRLDIGKLFLYYFNIRRYKGRYNFI